MNEVDFLAAQEKGEFVPVISFRATAHEDPPWARRAIKFLFVMALAAIMLGFVVFEWAQPALPRRRGISAEARQARRAEATG